MLEIVNKIEARLSEIDAELSDPVNLADRRKLIELNRERRSIVDVLEVGAGQVAGNKDGSLAYAVQEKNKYPYLVDDEGNWTVRQDVRYVRVMGSGTGPMRQFNNEWMTVKGGKIGPECGIGHYVGHATDAPVMILKSCIGNRSLGWDLLPPGGRSEY